MVVYKEWLIALSQCVPFKDLHEIIHQEWNNSSNKSLKALFILMGSINYYYYFHVLEARLWGWEFLGLILKEIATSVFNHILYYWCSSSNICPFEWDNFIAKPVFQD